MLPWTLPKKEGIIMEDVKPDQTLDARGLSCPMPVLKTKKAIETLQSGQILEIMSTDPGTRNDLPGWANRTGNTYLGEKEDQGFIRFYVKKK
jgi:tRNA 2-thiouridine synthesizing protein A